MKNIHNQLLIIINTISLQDRVSSSFFLNPLRVSETKKFINKLNSNKSTRSDLPKIKFLKMSAEIISPALTEILNRCIINGFFPDSLKLAEVIPIHKSGPKNDVNNYRPISLLSPFSKLLETHIYNNLINFLNKNDVIYHNQFGFRNNSSTDLAVINTINDLISSLENRKTTCSIFLDLAKAFNTVNHNILAQKLEKYGVRGPPLTLIKNYLKDRQQITNVNNFKSNSLKINVGVPQGSCLGPLLFLIYINDIHLITNFKVRLFADDACLSLSHTNPSSLELKVNNELEKINNWLQSNKLFLNYSKTNYLIFSKKKKKTKFSISINNNLLKQQHSAKYLGILIDDEINWKPHINNLRSSLSRSCFALSRLKNYVNKTTLKSVYYSLFYSKLRYCITSWGGCAESVLDPVVRLQKRAIRFISLKPPRTPTNPLFIELSMLKLSDVHKLEICKLINNMTINNKLNGELKVIKLQNQHDYETRLCLKNNFYSSSARTNLGRTSFDSTAPRFWRTVPTEFKNLNAVGFKLKYKHHLIGLY